MQSGKPANRQSEKKYGGVVNERQSHRAVHMRVNTNRLAPARIGLGIVAKEVMLKSVFGSLSARVKPGF